MKRYLINGRSNPALGESIASALGERLLARTVESFPDGEVQVRIEEDLNRSDVFVIQGTGPPVAENLIELMLLGDACIRSGAERLTAIVPYYGYARQDRRVENGECVGARLAADMIAERYQGIIAVDLHNPAIEGFFSIPVHHATVVPLLAEALETIIPRNSVIVAPDLGAAKLARRYADLLDLPTAHIHKVRRSGETVEALYLTGSVQDRVPVIVDDMISTGGTVAAAAKVLLDGGCTGTIYAAAAHGLFAGNALERLAPSPIERIFVSDSLCCPAKKTIPLDTVGIGACLAGRIEAVSGLGIDD